MMGFGSEKWIKSNTIKTKKAYGGKEWEQSLMRERDYDVDVKLKITFKNREFNCLLQPEIEEGIVEFLKGINGDYMIPESESIEFLGDEAVIAKYSFCCNDTSEAEAESFAKHMVHESDYKFKEMGYTLEAESYHGQKSDMSWLDEFERQIFG